MVDPSAAEADWKKARGILKDVRPGVPAEQLIREARDAMWGDEAVSTAHPFVEVALEYSDMCIQIGRVAMLEELIDEAKAGLDGSYAANDDNDHFWWFHLEELKERLERENA